MCCLWDLFKGFEGVVVIGLMIFVEYCVYIDVVVICSLVNGEVW